jgi:CysZ protein
MKRITGNVFKLLLMMIAFNIAILFFNFLPLFGSVLYAALNFLSTMFFLGFQFFDFPLERRRLVFRDKLRVVWEYRYMNMGLGLGFFFISICPLLGFLGLNLGTVGGTMLFIENIKPRMITGRGRKGTP